MNDCLKIPDLFNIIKDNLLLYLMAVSDYVTKCRSKHDEPLNSRTK